MVHCSKFTTDRALFALALITCCVSSSLLVGCAGVVSGKSSANVSPPVSGDTTPPAVSITSPAAGASISGSAVLVSANATDNVAVARVQFQLDGANLGTPVTAAPYTYSWDTTKSSNGVHTLRAIATDTSNNSATSAAVNVTVNNTTPDTTPPTVSMTSPANGSTVSGTAVKVSANASDNVAVGSVQFQLDGTNLGSLDITSPYSVSWDSTKSSNGSHSLRAIVKDTSNNSTTSATVTVTVSNVADTTAPSVPAGLVATAVASTQINLSWTASTDNVAVTGYKVFRGGAQVGTSSSTAYQDTGLTPSTSYTYTVAAFDGAGNTSAQSASASASTPAGSGGGGIPTTLGWYQIPNTAMSAICPSYPEIQATEGCSAVVNDWGSGLADTKRNQLIVWGGGHAGYYGNEVYSLNLGANPITMTLLKDATHGSALGSVDCVELYADGNPASKHSGGGLEYLPTQDVYFQQAWGKPSCGFFGDGRVWFFNPSTNSWANEGNNGGPNPAVSGSVSNDAYDSVSDAVYRLDVNTLVFWKYAPGTNSWTTLQTYGSGCGGTMSMAVVDPVRKFYFCSGTGNFWKISLNAPYTASQLTGSGCNGLPTQGNAGMAYDSSQKDIVFWNGGNSAYIYNPDTDSCTTATYSGGPAAAAVNGTFGRFRYFPGLGVFAVVNQYNQNAYILRLNAGSGGSSTALQDFQSRCAAAGVIVCEGFDDAAEFAQATYPNTGLYSRYITQDTSMYASGGGALHFPMAANGAPVQNDNWLQNFCAAHPPNGCTPQVFQQNSDFYIQFRYRVDSGYLQNWYQCCGSYPKIFDVANHASSCGQTELTIINYYATGMPTGYGACGGYAMYVDVNTGLFTQSTPLLLQSGYYNCEFGSPNIPLPPGGCFTMPANTWMTFYEHVHIGTYGQSNSVFELWVSTGTGPLQYVIKIPNFIMPNPDPGLSGYDAIWFNVFMTGFAGNNQAANVWLDEVIVSSQPITAPAATPAVQ